MAGSGDAEGVVEIAGARLSARIRLTGAELCALRVDGRDYLYDGDPRWWTGQAPLLFPVIGMLSGGAYHFQGRSYSLPKHGFARHATFELAHHEDTASTFRLEASDATLAVYPFRFRLDVTYRIAGGALSVTAAIGNLDDHDMPASFGFHPAFCWPLPGGARDDSRLRFAEEETAPIRRIGADGLLRRGRQSSPVRNRILHLRDDLFTDDAIIFEQPKSRSVEYGAPQGASLRVDFGGFRILGVWTKPGAPFLCVEPWAGLPDPVGFDGNLDEKPGIMLISPGTTKELTMTITPDAERLS